MSARPGVELPDRVSSAGPVGAAERVVSIDGLRGAALFGVLLINLMSGFRVPLAAHILGNDEPIGPGGSALLFLMSALVEFKAFAIFSFLFGVGVAIQSDRMQPGARTLFLMRRFGALLAIGLAHVLFIWNGDILTLYAVCGLMLIPLVNLPRSVLLTLGVLVIAANLVVSVPARIPGEVMLRQLSADALRTYRTGSWGAITLFRWDEARILILPLLLMSLPRTLGLMLCGVAAWRFRFFDDRRRVWCWMFVAGVAGCVAAIAARDGQLAVLPLAAVYTAGFLLWNPRARMLAAGGRMALSNYLAQSVVFGFVFYSYGLGWFGRAGVAAALAGAILLYVVQLICSEWWLRRFRFGPVEWVWRSLSYMKRQPFHRAA